MTVTMKLKGCLTVAASATNKLSIHPAGNVMLVGYQPYGANNNEAQITCPHAA